MIVVDSSAVVDALSAVEGADQLRAYLAAEELHAPALIDFEVVSTLRRLTRKGDLSAARAEDLLSDLEDLRLHRWPLVLCPPSHVHALRGLPAYVQAKGLAVGL